MVGLFFGFPHSITLLSAFERSGKPKTLAEMYRIAAYGLGIAEYRFSQILATFRAEVEADTDDLDSDTPPPSLSGAFIRFDGYETICKALVHTDRFDGGSSHTVYFFDGRHGYRFTMAAAGSGRFEAVAL